MSSVEIRIEGPNQVEPRTEIRAAVHWALPATPRSIQVRLFWYTEGRGDRDLSVVEERTIRPISSSGSERLVFQTPPGPYSFSGHLISLIWGLEAIAEPEGESDRLEIVLAPGGKEVRIGTR